MTPEPWPADPASGARMLMILIRDIDMRTYEDREDLLADLLSVPWPTDVGQSQ
jgi:hypothetical protein